ncbi:glycosyltransferase [bacterium]|nr:glycosyltransferase [bacterium]
MDLFPPASRVAADLISVNPSDPAQYGVSVVVMAYDEAASLRRVVEEIDSELTTLGTQSEILIIDDGSLDGTGTLADQLAEELPKVRVIHHPENRGLGGVYRTGFAEANFEYLTFFPADGQFPASILSQFAAQMKQNDLVLGYLPERSDSLYGKFLSAGERVLYKMLFRGFPRFQGIFMIRVAVLRQIKLTSTGRGWSVVMELILRAREIGCRMINVPTAIRPRQSGTSKVRNPRTVWSNLIQLMELRGKLPVGKSITSKLALVLFLALVHIATLQRYPALFVDEGWFGSRAWAFRTTQQAFGPLDRGVFDRFPGYWTYFPWIPNYLQHLTFLTSSAPGVEPLRFLSLLGGFLLLASVFSIGRRLENSNSAWLTLCLVALSRSFLYSSHLARYDILVAAFGFCAIALSLRNESKTWPHFAAGLLLGAAFETHPAGAMYAPVILILYFVQARWAALKSRPFWCFISGGVIGIAFYVSLHILRYPETWLTINRIAGSYTHKPPIFPLSLFLSSIQGTWQLAFYVAPYLLPLAVIAIPFLLLQRKKKNQILLTLLLGLPFAHSILLQHKLSYYAILFSPVLELSVAVFLVQITRHPWRVNLLKDVGKVGVYFLVLCGIIYSLLPLRYDWSQDYSAVAAQLKQRIRPNETVMGTQTWWFALPKNDWYSWETLHYFQRYQTAMSLEDAFLEFQPDIFIVDGHLASFVKQGRPGSYAEQLGLPPAELNAILKKYGRLRAEFDGGYYGPIRIFELHWFSKST